ncbi:MAG: AAA family ATPase, partial [bacterium]
MVAQVEEVVEALMKPEAYDEDVEEVRLLQTHISFVFLTGKYVYKIKKPVDFGFLNFTTLDKRKFFCEEEVRLNRRLCGDMYVGVVPITKQNDKIRVNGEGEVIEYAVKTKELPQDSMMTELLEKNMVGKKEISSIAE